MIAKEQYGGSANSGSAGRSEQAAGSENRAGTGNGGGTGVAGTSDGGAAQGGTVQAGASQGGTSPGGSTPGVGGATSGAVAFPLKIAPTGRYLVDRNNAPFLINQASSWGLIQSLSIADATAYLDALSQRGFNAVMVSIISYDVRMAGNPPAWQGISPFKVQWDFSSYTDAYFQHADEVIRLARARGMLVTLVPSYLGYPGDASQGWADEMLSPNNSVAKCQTYGRYLGNRYKDFDNIVWIAGGDNTPAPGSELEQRLKGVVDGIKQNDANHLWTGHWDAVAYGQGVVSTENPTFAPYMDINGYYAFNYDATQDRDLQFYNRVPTKAFFHLDQSYETEPGGTPENIRRKAYEAILMGAAGSSFCAGPTWYKFFDWRANMDTVGTHETGYWYGLFKSRAWFDLVPDQAHAVVTGGLGQAGTNDFVAAARTSNKATAIAYLPTARAVTVNMASLSGTEAKIWWYDPTTGKATDGGKMPTTGSKNLSPPSNGSWVLVIDDASLGLSAPGAQSALALPMPAPFPGGWGLALALLLCALVAMRQARAAGFGGPRRLRNPRVPNAA